MSDLSDLSPDPFAPAARPGNEAEKPAAGEATRDEAAAEDAAAEGSTAKEAGSQAGAEKAAPGKTAVAHDGGAGGEERVLLPVKRGLGFRLADLGRHPHTPPGSRRWSLLVAGAVGLAYWFAQWPLPRLLRDHPDYNFYLVQPAIWLTVAGLALYGWLRLADRPRFSRLLTGIALVVGIFHLAVLVIAGVIWDFGDSPSAGRLVNYPKNLLYFTTLLLGAETARAYLFQVWRRWNERVAFGAVTLLLFAVGVAAAQWTPFGTVDQGLRVVGGRWVPAIALSALCTWLVSYGGMGPSFAYRWVLVAFEWFSPILPSLEWPILLAIGLGVPVVAEWLVRSLYEETKEGAVRYPQPAAGEQKPKEPARPAWARWTGWGFTGAFVLVVVLFFVGVFGVHLSVVDGQSMEPAYSRGDLLFVQEDVDPASLRVNDVIQFHLGRLPVVHRIIEITEGPGGPVFITQGDNMSDPDDPVTADQIDGKVVFGIPGVGYLNLWVRGR